jgi:hypothetical protein
MSTSNPVCRLLKAVGGFDSHALPPTVCEDGGQTFWPPFFALCTDSFSRPKINLGRRLHPATKSVFKITLLLTLLNFVGQPWHGGTAAPHPWPRRPGPGAREQDPGPGEQAQAQTQGCGLVAAGPEHGAGHPFLWPPPGPAPCSRRPSTHTGLGDPARNPAPTCPSRPGP